MINWPPYSARSRECCAMSDRRTVPRYRIDPDRPCSVQEHHPNESWQRWQDKAMLCSPEQARWYLAILTGDRTNLPCCPTCGGPAPTKGMRHGGSAAR